MDSTTLTKEQLIERINQFKKEKNIAILAHYYVDGEIQDIADYIGDSYQLAKLATTIEQKVICFCGVNFMGESAKILNPDKKVIMPDLLADCPMARMIEIYKIEDMREQYNDLAVVAYVNTTADIKAYSDICVTSSNAQKIVSKLKEKNIFFIPDKNLGSYIKKMVPEKNIILNKGFCCVHNDMEKEEYLIQMRAHPDYKVLVHPEAQPEVVELGDYVGSTKALLDYVKESDAPGFIIGTEIGIIHQMKLHSPDKEFIVASPPQQCRQMKKNSLEKLYDAMNTLSPEVILDKDLMDKAYRPLMRMLEMTESC